MRKPGRILSRIIQISGIVLLVFFVPLALALFFDFHFAAMVFIIMGAAAGIILFITGNRLFKKIKLYEKYQFYVCNQGITAVEEIAKLSDQDILTAKTVLIEMIKKGYLPQDSTLVLPGKGQLRTVQCPGCNAAVVVGAENISKCDYCGQKL